MSSSKNKGNRTIEIKITSPAYVYIETNIRLKLAKRIKKLRIKCGYTQEKLSDLAEIDYKYLQRVEGKNPPALKIDTIEKIAKALKVKPDELLKF